MSLVEQIIEQDDEWLEPQEAAKILRVSPNTLAKWRCQKTYDKELPYSKRGKLIRYSKKNVQNFFNNKN